jgi:hypothetical protein
MNTNDRLDRIERAIAQIVTALEITVAWRPEPNFQAELGEIRTEQLQAIERSKAITRERVMTAREEANA